MSNPFRGSSSRPDNSSILSNQPVDQSRKRSKAHRGETSRGLDAVRDSFSKKQEKNSLDESSSDSSIGEEDLSESMLAQMGESVLGSSFMEQGTKSGIRKIIPDKDDRGRNVHARSDSKSSSEGFVDVAEEMMEDLSNSVVDVTREVIKNEEFFDVGEERAKEINQSVQEQAMRMVQAARENKWVPGRGYSNSNRKVMPSEEYDRPGDAS